MNGGNEMNEVTVVEYDKLFGLTSTGKVKIWEVAVTVLEDGTAAIDQIYGLLGGSLQTNRKIIREGKNLGKSNETSVIEQANSEAESKFTKKQDDGYSTDKDNLRVPMLPMLALKFNDRKKDIVYPAYTQPKLDGCRCFCEKVSDTEIVYTSRKGKAITTLGHITPSLLNIMVIGEIFDAEVYNRDMSLQQIMSAVKKQRPASLKLELWIFDVADTTIGYEERYTKYSSLPAQPYIVQVPAYLVDTEAEVHIYHDKFIQDGYEGIMIKNCSGGYKFKHRSKDLQKLKNFEDKEFEVIGSYEGEGTTYEGMITLLCKTKEGKEFGCNPKGTHAFKQSLWKNRDKLVGTWWTVRYQTLSDSGVPIFPVGISQREGVIGKDTNLVPIY